MVATCLLYAYLNKNISLSIKWNYEVMIWRLFSNILFLLFYRFCFCIFFAATRLRMCRCFTHHILRWLAFFFCYEFPIETIITSSFCLNYMAKFPCFLKKIYVLHNVSYVALWPSKSCNIIWECYIIYVILKIFSVT